MLRSLTMLLSLLLFLPLSTAFAVTYTWTDEQGTVHFTEDPGQVPRHLRGKVRKLDDSAPPPEEPVSPPPASTPPPAGGSEPAATYGGRSYAEWAKELKEREAAMWDVRRRTDEIRELLEKPGLQKEEAAKLLEEHKELRERFGKMKAEYRQFVERARKAGLKIDIQE